VLQPDTPPAQHGEVSSELPPSGLWRSSATQLRSARDGNMAIEILFEFHQLSEDNESGIATGWLPGTLSERGRELAREMGRRRRVDGIAAIFTSDLGRAVETVDLAFEGSGIPILHDWRLRECDYGELNGMPVERVHANRLEHADAPFPCGESWRQAIDRVGRVLDDLRLRWDDCRVLIVGHVVTRWALDHHLDGVPIEKLLTSEVVYQEGWEYRLP
jgi:2,3-bisphosphoglycerate-dependent phosphoglycerate mutase